MLCSHHKCWRKATRIPFVSVLPELIVEFDHVPVCRVHAAGEEKTLTEYFTVPGAVKVVKICHAAFKRYLREHYAPDVRFREYTLRVEFKKITVK